jgi:hypothetical protein
MKIRCFVTVILVFVSLFSVSQPKPKTENVILITFDGLRWQEVFTGADKKLISDKTVVEDTAALKKSFWANTPQERRQTLMPFFWNVIAKQGQLYGNRNASNKVNTTNKMWFSYPGYNEILSGSADDARVNSNDAVDNPNITVLEVLNKQNQFKGKIAAFTSWETFPWIINTKRSGIPVNSGYAKVSNPNEQEKLLNELMFQLPNESGGTRPDAFTFQFAFEFLKKNKPRVLFMAFDETDHFAHEGEYDRYLASAKYTDDFIRILWEWVQTNPAYKDKTTLIITTDHGRGNGAVADDWKHHGSKVPNADEIWIAMIGPDSPPLGEVKKEQQLYQNQVAKTLASFLNVNYSQDAKEGKVIEGAK